MINGNKSAYPYVETSNIGATVSRGLSKREEMAARALQGILSSYETQVDMQSDPRYNGENFAEVVAKNCVEFADCLLTELEKETNLSQ